MVGFAAIVFSGFSAGAPLSHDAYVSFRNRFGLPVRQLYGTTETGVLTINLSEDIDEAWFASIADSPNAGAVRDSIKSVAREVLR